MTWLFENSPIETAPNDCLGFVYLITNLTNNRKYIGKKLLYFTKTSQKTVLLKNGTKKKKKIKTLIESDWRDYWSSNTELKADVVTLGQENFKREILHFCKSKGDMSYLELKEQIIRSVLETDEYYNGVVQVRINKKHITIKKAP